MCNNEGLTKGLAKGRTKGLTKGIEVALELKFGEAGLRLMPEESRAIEDQAKLEAVLHALRTTAGRKSCGGCGVVDACVDAAHVLYSSGSTIPGSTIRSA